MANPGIFVPQPRHDILVEAIRTKEYGGRVHGAREGIGLRLFFGTSIKSIDMQRKEMDGIVEKKLASECELQKKKLEDLEAVYNNKLKVEFAHEREFVGKRWLSLLRYVKIVFYLLLFFSHFIDVM